MSNKNRHYFAFSLKIFNWIHDGYFLSEITDKKSFLSTEFFPLFPPICPIVIYRDYAGLFYFLFSSRLSVYSFSARPFHVRIFHSRTFHSCGFHARTRTSLHARFNKYASNMPRKRLSFALVVFTRFSPPHFCRNYTKFYNLTFFKTLDSDMQYKYNAISVETTTRNQKQNTYERNVFTKTVICGQNKKSIRTD